MTQGNGLETPDGKMCRMCRGVHNRSYGAEWKNVRGQVFVFVPDHPRSKKDGFYARSRLVMEGEIGRLLDPEERVWHKDDVAGNDEPGNLMLFDNQHELAQHRKNLYYAAKEAGGGGWAALTPAQRAYQELRQEEVAINRFWQRREALRELSNRNLRKGKK